MKLLKASGTVVGASTTDILTPTTGTKFVLTHYVLTVDVAGVIKMYDETDTSSTRFVYAYLAPGLAGLFSSNKLLSLAPMFSDAVDNALTVIVPAGTTLYWQIHYYEST